MCADSAEHRTLMDGSELLISRLLQVAKAVILLQDRRAELLMWEASRASGDQLIGLTDEAADCREVADAATELVVRVGGVRQPLVAEVSPER